jgi:hypothetical protein
MKTTCIAWCVLAAGVALAMFYNVRWNRSLAGTRFGHQYDETDDTARKLAPPEGNLALGFQGYDPARASDANFAARLYFRSTYILYPQRAFAAVPEGTLINAGDDILTAAAPPTREWQQSRNVRTLAVFSVLPNGESFVRPVPIDP